MSFSLFHHVITASASHVATTLDNRQNDVIINASQSRNFGKYPEGVPFG